jgi:hypothetical protein
MDSEQSSELFDSESKKLQDTLESIQKKSDKTIPEIIDVYYQVIKVDSLAKVLKENFQTKPEHEAFLARIDKIQKYISEEFNVSFHPKILTQLTDSIQKNTENLKLLVKESGQKSKETIEKEASLYKELREIMSTKEFVEQYENGIKND